MALDFSGVLFNSVYMINFVFVMIFFLTRRALITELKRKFFTGKGYVFVRMIMPDRHEVEDFVNIKKSPIRVGDRSFLIDPSTATLKSVEESTEKEKKEKGYSSLYRLDPASVSKKGKYPVFTFRYDSAEPINLFDIEKKMDSSYFDMVIKKALTQASIKDMLGANKRIIMFLMGAAIAAAAAAYFSYESYTMMQDLIARGVGLSG